MAEYGSIKDFEADSGDVDRAVQALIDAAWEGEWDRPVTADDLAAASAIVLRVVRDDLALAAIHSGVRTHIDVERFLNDRIRSLTGTETITGDTTMVPRD